MLNKVILIGRLGKDPKSGQSQSGRKYCNFTLATNSGYGENQTTDWHQIACFDKTAEAVGKYLSKGAQCYVEGRITYDTYEVDGVKRTSTKILANTVLFIGGKQDKQVQEGVTSVQSIYEGVQNAGGFAGAPLSDETFDGVPF